MCHAEPATPPPFLPSVGLPPPLSCSLICSLIAHCTLPCAHCPNISAIRRAHLFGVPFLASQPGPLRAPFPPSLRPSILPSLHPSVPLSPSPTPSVSPSVSPSVPSSPSTPARVRVSVRTCVRACVCPPTRRPMCPFIAPPSPRPYHTSQGFHVYLTPRKLITKIQI